MYYAHNHKVYTGCCHGIGSEAISSEEDAVDGNVNDANKETDKAHNGEADCRCGRNPHEL